MIGHVIELESRPRWGGKCVEELASIGVDARLFPGCDGHDQADVSWLLRRRRRFTPGEIGCFASHVKLARAAVAGDLAPVGGGVDDWWLVFEDDARARGSISAETLRVILQQAVAGGFDFVFLTPGRGEVRARGRLRVIPSLPKETWTHAYLANRKAMSHMAAWIMVCQIDVGIRRWRHFSKGGLCGIRTFEQRPWRDSPFSICAERRGGSPKPSVVSARLRGGLGNQMFQIAAAANVAARLGAGLEIESAADYRPRQGKNARGYQPTIFSKLPPVLDHQAGYVMKEAAFHHSPLEIPPVAGRLVMDGYWQSAKYHDLVHPRDLFDFSWYDASVVAEVREKLGKPLCAVHFRGGDYVKHKHHYLCKSDYYQPVLDGLRERYAIVLVTDDLARARAEVGAHDHLVHGSEESDMAFMLHCDAIVIGNSTFAWWAACLGSHQEVHAPEDWFPKGHPNHRNDIPLPTWKLHPLQPVKVATGDKLLEKVGRVAGVIHVGAHEGQEVGTYLGMGASALALVEPDPRNFDLLARACPAFAALFRVALSNCQGSATFHIARNSGQSSSLLIPSGHKSVFPRVVFSGSFEVPVTTLDSLPLDFSKFDLLVLDTQGNELRILERALAALSCVRHVITEFSIVELYEGGCLLPDLDAFLTAHGFEQREILWRGRVWGDVLYSRVLPSAHE